MPDFGGAELETFRAEARQWLEANFPPSLRRGADAPPADPEAADKPSADADLWKRRIGEKGWGVPTWPAEHGGGGLTPAEARVLRDEMERIGATNPIGGMGVGMFGPTLLEYGNDAQIAEHIPRIARGEVRWCQGFSEPGAGSDLASLQTKAVDAGDHWVINGQKTWTSGAQYSDWCGCLVRTDPTAKKHDGISFMLIDMHQKEIETRPIALIAGASPFCETFFTDATAPKDALLGQLNVGWTVGKRLLQHERASQTGASMGGRTVPLDQLAKQYVELDADGRIADLDLRTRLTRHLMDAKVHGLTLARAMAEAKGNQDPGNAPSVLKNSATNVAQTRAELTLEIYGHQGLGWSGSEFTREELESVRGWLGGKAMSIYGGSAEIQNNIVSKRILGLPDNTQST